MESKKEPLLCIISYEPQLDRKEGRVYCQGMDNLSPLEALPNPEPKRRYEVEFTCPEWTAVCPRSGFPDFATIYVKYKPKDWIVELKSLKLYINSYRNIGIFHEAAVNQILTDLVKCLDPWWMEVVGDFNVRGNIKTIIRASQTHSDYNG